MYIDIYTNVYINIYIYVDTYTYIYIYIYIYNGCEIFAKQKNVFLVTLKISHIVVTTALKKIYIYIYK